MLYFSRANDILMLPDGAMMRLVLAAIHAPAAPAAAMVHVRIADRRPRVAPGLRVFGVQRRAFPGHRDFRSLGYIQLAVKPPRMAGEAAFFAQIHSLGFRLGHRFSPRE